MIAPTVFVAKALPFLDSNQQRLVVIIATFFSIFYLLSRLNAALNTLALNHWFFRPQGAPWVFDGKTELAIVTGGSSGFGRLIAKGFASKMRVIVLDVVELPPDLASVPNITYHKCDLTSPTSITSTLHTLTQTHGAPTILINNAGIGRSHTLLETSDAWLESIFRVNVLSHFTLIRELLPGMLEKRKGHVFALASMASYAATANLVDYCATKAAVLSLHQGLTQELHHRYPAGPCIRTSIIHPIWARTPLVKSWEHTLDANREPLLDPQVVADAVVNQVLSGKSGQLYLPKVHKWTAGMNAWPVWLQEFARGLSARNTVTAVKKDE